MPSRRSVLAGLMLAAGGAPAGAASQPGRDAVSLLRSEGRYLPLWRDVLAAPDDGANRQRAAFVGDEKIAFGSAAPSPTFTLAPEARAEDAVTAIRAAARGRRVVFLNEAHSASRHRHFLATLLRALREDGFSVLAAETFMNDPAGPSVQAMRPGDPFLPGMGYYTSDPVFAEAVREALGLGYRLAAYEHTPSQRSTDPALGTAARIALREAAQSANLQALMTAAPNARVVVFCGYAHLRKTADRNGNLWAAARLAQATGIELLSVSQAYTGSFGPHGDDPASTAAVLERFAPTTPIVVRSGGESLGAAHAGADLAVFHPSLPDVDGRPGWLAADRLRHRVEVKLPDLSPGEPAIVQAVHAADPDPAVPADLQVLTGDQRRAGLYLRSGAYRLRLERDGGFTALGEVRL